MLIFKNVSKKFGRRIAVSHFSYVFCKGKIYSLIGPSGSGKTTLLKMIQQEINQYEGDIYYEGKNIRHQKNFVFEQVGAVSQNYQLFDELTALENILLPFYLKEKNIPEEKKKTAMKLARQFQVFSCLHQKVKHLSGGEKQRIAIIRALIRNSSVLLLDEPTSALDQKAAEQLLRFLHEKKKNKIILLVTHDLSLAEKTDQIVDIQNVSSNLKEVMNPKVIREKKLRFCKLNFLRKKVFASKKMYNYLSVSILSMGLIGLSISYSLQSFLDRAVGEIFRFFDTEQALTLKMPSSANATIDFTTEILPYETIYYEGIERQQKEAIKQACLIDHADFNGYRLDDYSFIFDNYLCDDLQLTLMVPSTFEYYKKKENYIHLHYLEQVFRIQIDQVMLSEEDHFSIYCNSVSYLFRFFDDYAIEIQKERYLFSSSAKNLYDYLCSQKRYLKYIFYLIDDSLIRILPLPSQRILYADLLSFYQKNEASVRYYVLADQQNVYIDFASGLIYCLKYFSQEVQIQVDTTLQENEYALSSLAYQSLNLSEIDMEMHLKEVREESRFAILYVSEKTLNQWCKKEEIFVAFFAFRNTLTDDTGTFLINPNLFSISSFKILSSIRSFLLFFSSMILIFACISSFSIFNLTFQRRKKDLYALQKLGVYPEKIMALFCYEPLRNVAESSFVAMTMTLLFEFLLVFTFNYFNHTKMQVNIVIFQLLALPLIALLTILPLLIFAFVRFLTKK